MRTATLAAFLVAVATAAYAAPRAALVIGNETYLTGQPAPGAVEGAMAAAERLAEAGFEVTFGRDLGSEPLADRLATFEDHVRDAEVAIVVYVGRAVAFGGATWLVPVDADADTLTELGRDSTPLALPLGIAGRAGAAIAIVDGAWPARFDGAPGLGVGAFHELPGVRPGLAPVADDSVLIIAASSPAAEAPPRELDIADFALRAIDALLADGAAPTDAAAQIRAVLPGAYVAGRLAAESVSLTGPSAPDLAEQLALWKDISRQAATEGYAEYLRQYPNGIYAHAARDRLEELEAGDDARVEFAIAAEDALGLTQDQRRAIQKALHALGHEIAAADGVFGSDTRAAIHAWQLGEGQEPTGFLSREGARSLLGLAENAAK